MIHMDDGHLKNYLESYRFPAPYTLVELNAALRILKPRDKVKVAIYLSEYIFIKIGDKTYCEHSKEYSLDQAHELSNLLSQAELLLNIYKRINPLYLLGLCEYLQDDEQKSSINLCLLQACQKLNQSLCEAGIDTDTTGWSKALFSNWDIPRRGRGAPAKHENDALVTYLAAFFERHGTSARGKMRFIRAAIEPFGFTDSSLTDSAIKSILQRETKERANKGSKNRFA